MEEVEGLLKVVIPWEEVDTHHLCKVVGLLEDLQVVVIWPHLHGLLHQVLCLNTIHMVLLHLVLIRTVLRSIKVTVLLPKGKVITDLLPVTMEGHITVTLVDHLLKVDLRGSKVVWM